MQWSNIPAYFLVCTGKQLVCRMHIYRRSADSALQWVHPFQHFILLCNGYILFRMLLSSMCKLCHILQDFLELAKQVVERQKMTSKADNLFTLYNGCVFSSTNAHGIVLLQEGMDLLLQNLQKEAWLQYLFILSLLYAEER